MSVPTRTFENSKILDKIALMPVATYTFGFCYYGRKGKPFRTVDINADSMEEANEIAWKQRDNVTHSICIMRVQPNAERVKLMKEVGWIK